MKIVAAIAAGALILGATVVVVSGCGSGSSTGAGSTTTNANMGPKQKHFAVMVNGDDAAFKAFCDAKTSAARRLELPALRQEVLNSPCVPSLSPKKLAHVLRGACAGPPE